jgi:hypothetical protein
MLIVRFYLKITVIGIFVRHFDLNYEASSNHWHLLSRIPVGQRVIFVCDTDHRFILGLLYAHNLINIKVSAVVVQVLQFSLRFDGLPSQVEFQRVNLGMLCYVFS